MIKKIIIVLVVVAISTVLRAQTHLDQSGLKTTITSPITGDASAKRFEIASIGFNAYHWQNSSVIVVELFGKYYRNGYEKYTIEVGFEQGANSGSPQLKLRETFGPNNGARIVLGTPTNLSSSFGDHPNKVIPVYLELNDYAIYQVRLTYLHDKVDQITWMNQIKVNASPTGVNIASFLASKIMDVPVKTSSAEDSFFAGKVGLAQGAPRARLEVAPSPGVTEPAALFRSNGGQAWGTALTLATDHPGGDDARLLFSYRAGAKNWAIGGYHNHTRFGLFEDAGDGIFGTGFGTERFTVLAGGNVGIGTATPTERLSVNGKILTKEIRVQPTGWADYVFNDGYENMPLAQIEQYIQKNKHLPEIPSAKQVADEGVALGEMNKLLLKKIEELTLHLIEKDKQLKLVIERVSALEQKK